MQQKYSNVFLENVDRRKPAASQGLWKVKRDLPDPTVYCLRGAVRCFSVSMRNMVEKKQTNKFRFGQFPVVTSLGCMCESVFKQFLCTYTKYTKSEWRCASVSRILRRHMRCDRVKKKPTSTSGAVLGFSILPKGHFDMQTREIEPATLR